MPELPDSPLSLWLAEYGDYTPRPALAGDLTVDVAVIGGGFLGLSTAMALRERPDPPSVAVLEARDVGYGASGRNGSFAMTVTGLGFATTAMLRGKDFLRRAHRYLERCVDDLDAFIDAEQIDARKSRPGFLRVATAPPYVKRLQREVRLMESLGADGLEWIDAAATRAMVDSPRYLGAMWEPRLLLLDPARLVRGERDRAVALGADVYEHTPVLSVVRPGGGRGYRLLTPAGSVSAERLVYATNAYSDEFPQLRRRQQPAFTSMIATEPLSDEQLEPIGWAGGQGVEDARNLIHYYRITPDRRIVLGGGPVGLGRGASLGHDANPAAWRHLREHLHWLFPHLGDVRVTHRWGGPFSVTVNLTPTLGYVGDDRTAVHGLGCIGHGVAMSYDNGKVLADLLVGDGRGELTAQCPFVTRRPLKWPPEPVATGAKFALRAYLRAEDAVRERAR